MISETPWPVGGMDPLSFLLQDYLFTDAPAPRLLDKESWCLKLGHLQVELQLRA